jgi:CheY-like chemotaxis protein
MFRILIADDSDDARVFIRAAIATRGWTVCGEATNGRQAVLMASQLKPDLIILDLSMPMLTGLEATREILRAIPGQPIILFTLHASPQLNTAAANVGARKVVSKSEGLNALVDAIEKIADSVRPASGSRGDPGGGASGTTLPFAPMPSPPESKPIFKPRPANVLPHAEPLVAASSSRPPMEEIREPAESESSPTESSEPAAPIIGSVSEPTSEA